MTGPDMQTRPCRVDGELGLFRTWEYYSEPLVASPKVGGAVPGVFIRVFGVVEFSGVVRRVNPADIAFCDEAPLVPSEAEKAKEEKT